MQTTAKQQTFTSEERDLLGKTSDALTGWLGQPVICEINQLNDGFECALIGMAADINEDSSKTEYVNLSLGGAKTDIVGQAGGLIDIHETPYECSLMFNIAIQYENEQRTIWLTDAHGELKDFSTNLKEILPFSMQDDAADNDWEDDHEEE